jgi:hypothetical protein
MTKSTTYYTLIGSLPALPRHFEEAERVPISSRRLDERLKMLEPRDADVIELMSKFLVWDRQPLDLTDEDVLRQYEQFIGTVDNRFARELIRTVITNRTIWVGLRCRRLGIDPPRGIAPIAGQIARHWNHPDFALGTRYPWISQVDALLMSDSPSDLYRKQLDIAWQHAKRLADQYQFTFEAVVLYLIRWELVYRWTRRSVEAGQQKFEQLVTEAMGEFSNMFAT